MTDERNPQFDERVLILAPTGRDADLTQSILVKAGIAAQICHDDAELCREAERGAGCLLVTEEALSPTCQVRLAKLFAHQPPWSDLPLQLLTRQGANSPIVVQSLDMLRNISLLERPIRVSALVSIVQAALRARRRQYELRDRLESQAEADRRKDEFLATLAHELRNPLAPIRNSLHLLRLSGNTDPVVQRVREMMERQVDHMVRLVDDLLEVSRISRGKIELRKERVELAAVIRSAVETSQPLLDAAGHQLAVSLPSQPITLSGDPVRLAQVFANLLNNAAKYAKQPGQVWLTARVEGDEVVVAVRDTGIGIATDMLPRVFEMFMQVEGPHHGSQGGLGIGLALVRSLVQLHGGSVSATSDGLGRGSEFIVRLPLTEPVAISRVSPLPNVQSLSPARVLVVDDNRDAADSLGMLLRALGAEVTVVHDGAAALDRIAEVRPTTVLLDIGMPGLDGYEVARRIRQLPDCRGVVLIALTGWGQEEDRRRTRAAGFDHHLVKPTDMQTLHALMSSVGSSQFE